MRQDECEAFVRRCVGHALARDGSSGGCIRTVAISAAGVKRSFLPNDEVGVLWLAFCRGFFDPWYVAQVP
jgi:20S proteasome subunit beta 1